MLAMLPFQNAQTPEAGWPPLRRLAAARRFGEAESCALARRGKPASLSAIAPAKAAGAAILRADGPINEEGLSDDLFPRKIAPSPRIGAVHGVVAHDHIVVWAEWKGAGHGRLIGGNAVVSFVWKKPRQA